jgi:hypothetical protein
MMFVEYVGKVPDFACKFKFRPYRFVKLKESGRKVCPIDDELVAQFLRERPELKVAEQLNEREMAEMQAVLDARAADKLAQEAARIQRQKDSAYESAKQRMISIDTLIAGHQSEMDALAVQKEEAVRELLAAAAEANPAADDGAYPHPESKRAAKKSAKEKKQ